MVKWHIQNELTEYVKSCDRFKECLDQERLYSEIKNATLQGIESKLLDEAKSGNKRSNNVNSILLWVLEITNEFPSDYQTIKSPGSYADIDTDFSKLNRNKVIDYLKNKYGIDKIANIATFGTMAAKGAIRNSARALGYPIASGEKIAKYISDIPGIKIQDCIDSSKEFQDLLLKDKESKHIVNIAKKLEGLPNSIGMHASGIVATENSLTEYLPLMNATRKDSDSIITQFEYYDVEALGIIKYDILGLKSLDVINETVNLIKKNNRNFTQEDIDIEDPNIYTLFENGLTTLLFQFESQMFVEAAMKVKPKNIHDISAITSAWRPGCLANGLHEQYINAKINGSLYNYDLKDKKLINKIQDICKETYSLMLYQEQCMACFTEIAGFDEISSDTMRRSLGKKIQEIMDKNRESFIEGGLKNGYTKEGLIQLFEKIELYSGYSFNKSHAYLYSYITLEMAWLSYYYPLEFFTAALTVDSGNTDDVRSYIKAIKDRGLKILPPDINRSDADFTIKDDAIVFGLSAIKGVGAAVTKKIMSRKPKSGYKTLGHFIRRNVDILNSKILESYTKAGCFNSFGYNKESILQNISYILELIGIVKNIDKYTIFDTIDLGEYIEKCLISKIDKEDSFQYEIESLGLYITKHPMDEYDLNTNYVCDISKLAAFEDQDPFVSVGCLSGIEIRKTKAKLNMCSFNLTTGEDSVKCIMFPKVYSQFLNSDFIQEGAVVYINGKIKVEESGKIIIVNEISDKVDKYLIKKKKQENIFKRLGELKEEDFIQHSLNLQLSKIKVILEK